MKVGLVFNGNIQYFSHSGTGTIVSDTSPKGYDIS
jgi:hypothetical protein